MNLQQLVFHPIYGSTVSRLEYKHTPPEACPRISQGSAEPHRQPQRRRFCGIAILK